jgi:cytochrome bd-type quinol oxidase subunit 2
MLVKKIKSKKSIIGIFSILGWFFSALGALAANGVVLPENVGLPKGTVTDVVSNFTKWILGIFGFLAIISFVISGIMYFLSAGDDKQQEKAKKQMQWSILGVVVGLAGMVIIWAVDTLLRGTNFSF